MKGFHKSGVFQEFKFVNIDLYTNSSVDGNDAPKLATDAVLMPSEELPADSKPVQGFEFNDFNDKPITVEDIVNGMTNTGFQASAIAEGVRIINNMVRQERTPMIDTSCRTIKPPQV